MSEMNEKVRANAVVGVAFELYLTDGTLVDNATADRPMYYLHGHEELLPAIQAALINRKVGDKIQLILEPADAYEERDPDAVATISKYDLPEDAAFEPGMVVELEDEESGEYFDGVVIEVNKDEIILDLNHPLAGETLRYELTVVSMRAATEAEIEHGHAHEKPYYDE